MRTGSISHPAESRYLIVREHYLAMCEQNHAAAMLLGLFEYWYNVMSESVTQAKATNDALEENNEPRTQSEELWVWKSYSELEQDLMGIFGRKQITAAVHLLVEKEFVLSRNHPDYKWVKKPQYLLNVPKIKGIIDSSQKESSTMPNGNHRLSPKGIIDDSEKESSARAHAPVHARSSSYPVEDSIDTQVMNQKKEILEDNTSNYDSNLKSPARARVGAHTRARAGAPSPVVEVAASDDVAAAASAADKPFQGKPPETTMSSEAASVAPSQASSVFARDRAKSTTFRPIRVVKQTDSLESEKVELPQIAEFLERQMRGAVQGKRIGKRTCKKLTSGQKIRVYADPQKRNVPASGESKDYPSPEELWCKDELFREWVADRVKYALKNDKPSYELAANLIVDYGKPRYGWIEYELKRRGATTEQRPIEVYADQIVGDW